jgi:hypothetical protein
MDSGKVLQFKPNYRNRVRYFRAPYNYYNIFFYISLIVNISMSTALYCFLHLRG